MPGPNPEPPPAGMPDPAEHLKDAMDLSDKPLLEQTMNKEPQNTSPDIEEPSAEQAREVVVGPCECGGYGVVLSEEYDRCHIPASDVPGESSTDPDDPTLSDLHEGRYGQLAAESLSEYREVLKVMEDVRGLGTYSGGDSFRHYADEAEENGYDWVARMFRHAAWVMDERAHLRRLIRDWILWRDLA